MQKITNFANSKSKKMKRKSQNDTNLEIYNIDEEGIVVIDNVTKMPEFGQPYLSPHLTVCINHKGVVEGEYDSLPLRFDPLDIAMVYPNHLLTIKQASRDYKMSLVVASMPHFVALSNRYRHLNRFMYESNPLYRLDEDQYLCVKDIVETMRQISKLDVPARKELMSSAFDVLVRMIEFFRQKNAKSQPVNKIRLSTQFYNALVEHCLKERNVDFYAELFHLTTKHFSTTIKQETGYSASHWIRLYVVAQSKMLLRNEPNMSLQDVSVKLGFNNQATMSRFFKRETGMTPSEYRWQFEK